MLTPMSIPGLSKTVPTVVLEPHQFRHRESFIGTHKDMNDGIARMSRSFARKVASCLGLCETPCVFQARIGSAKGIWIIDADDDGLDDNDVWIETYPSQRKWKCPYEDVNHRVFEVREWSRGLVPATLNAQFIPVLEAQSLNFNLMRGVLADHLKNGLEEELGGQTAAMTHPMNLRSWAQRGRNGFSTPGQISYLGALPDREEDEIPFLLDAGFDATKTPYLRNKVWKAQKRQAEQIKNKMNIKVGHPRQSQDRCVG